MLGRLFLEETGITSIHILLATQPIAALNLNLREVRVRGWATGRGFGEH